MYQMAPAALVYSLRLLQVVSGRIVAIEKILGLEIKKLGQKVAILKLWRKEDFLCVKNRASKSFKNFAFLKTYV